MKGGEKKNAQGNKPPEQTKIETETRREPGPENNDQDSKDNTATIPGYD